MLNVWRSSNGFLCDELIPLSSQLVLFDGRPSNGGIPDLLLAGPGSLSTILLGDNWASSPEKVKSDLDEKYLRMVSDGYARAAQNLTPVFDLISTDLQRADGVLLPLRYQRLILPFATDQGAVFLMCYSHDASNGRSTVGLRLDGKHLPMPSPQSISHANSAQPAISPK